MNSFTVAEVLNTAALSLPDDALYHILKEVKPSVQVFFSMQDIPEEDVSFPYLLIDKMGDKTTGTEYGPVSGNSRSRYVSKECAFTLTYVGANAVGNLGEYVENKDDFYSIMNKLNVSLVLQDSVLNVSAIIDTTTEERAQVEGGLRYVDTSTENVGSIGTITVGAEVFDIDGTKVYDEEIEITD
jgi:hypothetical protein